MFIDCIWIYEYLGLFLQNSILSQCVCLKVLYHSKQEIAVLICCSFLEIYCISTRAHLFLLPILPAIWIDWDVIILLAVSHSTLSDKVGICYGLCMSFYSNISYIKTQRNFINVDDSLLKWKYMKLVRIIM